MAGHRHSNIQIGRAEYRAEVQFFFQALASSRELVKASLSPSELLCTTGMLAIVDEQGRPLYVDTAHMTKSTAEYWVQVLEHPTAN